MSTKAILDELKFEVARSKKWKRKWVSIARIEAMIRMQEVQTPGDISDQPGEWTIRGGNVEAMQHDGTSAGAAEMLSWIRERGGTVSFLGTYDQEIDTLRLRLDSPRQPNVIGPQWWVVKTADGFFFAVPDLDFRMIYVKRTDV